MNSNGNESSRFESRPMKYYDEKKQPISRTQWITDKLLLTYMVMSKPEPSPLVTTTMAKDLNDELSDEQLLRGLSRLRKEREWVSVAAIIELSGARNEDGRPGVEAAWAMCPKDENLSTVWTEEMAEAFGLCRSLLADGEEVGARMAFKESYTQIVARSRQNRIPVKWIVSLGWDRSDRVRALSEAIEKKRIEPKQALGLLGPEQQDELLLHLPVPERKLLTGNIVPNQERLSGVQKSLLALREGMNWPELPKVATVVPLTDEEKRERRRVALRQARQMVEDQVGHTLTDAEYEQHLTAARQVAEGKAKTA